MIEMPIGIIVNTITIFCEGLVGSIFGQYIEERIKKEIVLVFGICSIGMGISSIDLIENISAIIFACHLVLVVSVIAIPQFIIFYLLFLASFH